MRWEDAGMTSHRNREVVSCKRIHKGQKLQFVGGGVGVLFFLAFVWRRSAFRVQVKLMGIPDPIHKLATVLHELEVIRNCFR